MIGTRRIDETDDTHLRALNAGLAQSRTLTEALAVDQVALLHRVLPRASTDLLAEVVEAQSLGILKRMQATGAALYRHVPEERWRELAGHASDTVRGWACFAVAADPASRDVDRVLADVRPAADDSHFGVREWVWMAVRPHLVNDLERSIELLAGWTGSPSERIRRFASEALRPHGVWARHIGELKKDPDRGLRLLEPLKADSARYVQDSVANWINDASKTSPEWARELCGRWSEESPVPETKRIVGKALRSLS